MLLHTSCFDSSLYHSCFQPSFQLSLAIMGDPYYRATLASAFDSCKQVLLGLLQAADRLDEHAMAVIMLTLELLQAIEYDVTTHQTPETLRGFVEAYLELHRLRGGSEVADEAAAAQVRLASKHLRDVMTCSCARIMQTWDRMEFVRLLFDASSGLIGGADKDGDDLLSQMLNSCTSVVGKLASSEAASIQRKRDIRARGKIRKAQARDHAILEQQYMRMQLPLEQRRQLWHSHMASWHAAEAASYEAAVAASYEAAEAASYEDADAASYEAASSSWEAPDTNPWPQLPLLEAADEAADYEAAEFASHEAASSSWEAPGTSHWPQPVLLEQAADTSHWSSNSSSSSIGESFNRVLDDFQEESEDSS
jgi:hypothetical protein